MKQNNNHKKNLAAPGNRSLAALGFHLSETSAPSACPDEEEMAAFIDNANIDDPQFCDLYKHLNECEACYQQWLAITSLHQETLTDKIAYHLKNRRSLSILGSAMAVAATVLIIFQMPSKDALHKQLSTPQAEPQHYEMMLQEGQQSDKETLTDEQESFNMPLGTAAPAPLLQQAEESDDKVDAKVKKEKMTTTLRSVKPIAADSAPVLLAIKQELRLFCDQPSFDEEKKSQLFKMLSQLSDEELQKQQLHEIKDILSKMTVSSKQELCEQMQPLLKK